MRREAERRDAVTVLLLAACCYTAAAAGCCFYTSTEPSTVPVVNSLCVSSARGPTAVAVKVIIELRAAGLEAGRQCQRLCTGGAAELRDSSGCSGMVCFWRSHATSRSLKTCMHARLEAVKRMAAS